MKKIYFIRHGIAEPGENDIIRPLTKEGIVKTTKVAQRLAQQGIKFDLMLFSPLVRASQTAQILANLAEQIEQCEHLSPDGQFSQWLQEFSEKDFETLALVGHQPNLTNWAEQMIWGTIQNKLILKKAGIIGIEIPTLSEGAGRGSLFLLTSPKWLLG
jgi:phosphohistidine phosphatase